MNSNVNSILDQIENTIDLLRAIGLVKFSIPCEYGEVDGCERVSWKNHHRGREVSSKAFNSISQYLAILSDGAYQACMKDNSLVRASYKYDHGKLVSHTLLWWPCPVEPDIYLEEKFGLEGSIKKLIGEATVVNDLKMRTPIRIDFDIQKDTMEHPASHVHMQHYDSRTNCVQPLCFNKFMRFILSTHYPQAYVDYKHWHYLTFQYEQTRKPPAYKNKTIIAIG